MIIRVIQKKKALVTSKRHQVAPYAIATGLCRSHPRIRLPISIVYRGELYT